MSDVRPQQDNYVPPKEVTPPSPTPTPTEVERTAGDNLRFQALKPPGQGENKDGLPGDGTPGVQGDGKDEVGVDGNELYYCSITGEYGSAAGREQTLKEFREAVHGKGLTEAEEEGRLWGLSADDVGEALKPKEPASDNADPTKKKPGADAPEDKTEAKKDKPEDKKDKPGEKPKPENDINNETSWFGNFVSDTAKKAVSTVSDIVHDAMSYFGKYGEGMLDSLGLTSSSRSGDGQQLASVMLNNSDSTQARQAFRKLDSVENGVKLDSAVGGLIDQSRKNGDLTTGGGRQNADKIVDSSLGDGHTAASVKEMLGGKFEGKVQTDSKTGEKVQTDGKGNTRIESKDGKNVTLKLSDGTVVNQKTGEDGKTTESFLFAKKAGKDGGFMRTTTDNKTGQTNFEYNNGKNYEQQVDLARLVMSKDSYSFDRCNKNQDAIHADKDRTTLVDQQTKNHVGIDRENGDIVINSRDQDGKDSEVRMRLNPETGAFDFFQRDKEGKDTKLTDEQVEQVKKQLQLTGSGDQYRVGNTEINRQLVSQLLSSGVRQEIKGGNADGSVGVKTVDTNTGRGLDANIDHPANGGKTTTETTEQGEKTGEERIFDPTTARIDGFDDKGNPIIYDPTTGQLKTPEIDKEKDGADVKINDTGTKVKPDGSVVDADGFVIMDGDGTWWGDERDCCGMTPQEFERYQSEQRADEAQARALGNLAYAMIATGNINLSVVNAAMGVARSSLSIAQGIDNGTIRALAECAALDVLSRGNKDIAGAKTLAAAGEGSEVNKILAENVTIGGPGGAVAKVLHDRDERNNVEDLDAYRRARGLA